MRLGFATIWLAAVMLAMAPWPALRARVDRCEALEVFRSHYSPFSAPAPTAQANPA